MKTARKALMLILCAALLVSATVMGTLASLTANTGMVNNTFTVGKVEIDLTETKVDVYGKVDTTATSRVKTNDYKLVANHLYTKDPRVEVKSGSENCYLFIKINNTISAIESNAQGYVNIEAQMRANNWEKLTGVENVYYYAGTEADNGIAVAGGNYTIFSNFKIADTYAGAAIEALTIDAYAVQADGFDNAAAAWGGANATWEF